MQHPKRSVAIFSIWLLLALTLNLHLTDLGETYVSRNTFAWIFMAGMTAALWWLPLRRGDVVLNLPVAAGMAALPIGALLVCAVNVLAFDSYHPGHLFLPGMLALFALLVLGLQQTRLTADHWSLGVVILLLAFMPQFILYMLVNNPLVFFQYEFSLPRIFFKPHGGFGQWNLYGSFLSSLLLLTTWAICSLPMPRNRQRLLFVLLAVYALDTANLLSKTGLVGFVLGFGLMAAHVVFAVTDKRQKQLFAVCIGIVAAAFLLTSIAAEESTRENLSAAGWQMQSNSIQTRLAMWLIAWRSFLEAPLFGHGLGSYLLTYIDHFGRYGVTEGLRFYPVVSIPHNLVMHVLSETGVFGVLMLLAPLFFTVGYVLKTSAHRLLLLALIAPVAVHCLLEYPYIASGMHYLVLALGISAALFGILPKQNVTVLSALSEPRRLQVYGAIVFVAGCVAAGAAVMQATATQAAVNYSNDMRLSLATFAEVRYRRDELDHPIIGRRMTAMSDLHLTTSILKAGRPEWLVGGAIPRIEQNIIPYYASPGVWEVALTAYGAVGDKAKFLEMLERVGRYDPVLQEKFRQRFIRATGAGR